MSKDVLQHIASSHICLLHNIFHRVSSWLARAFLTRGPSPLSFVLPKTLLFVSSLQDIEADCNTTERG